MQDCGLKALFHSQLLLSSPSSPYM
jgi:hypothetical protein